MIRDSLRQQIEEKLDELMVLCINNQIPMFAVVADNKEHTTDYISRVLTPAAAETTLKNDKITKFNAALGNEFYIKVKMPEQEKSTADLIGDFLLEE